MSLFAPINHASILIAKVVLYCHVFLLRRRGCSISIGERIQYFGKPILMLMKNSHFHLGSGCTLRSSFKSNVLGVQHPVVFCTLREDAIIFIGDNVGISGGTLCAATSIRIGNSTLIGANVTIADTDFHPVSPMVCNAKYF